MVKLVSQNPLGNQLSNDPKKFKKELVHPDFQASLSRLKQFTRKILLDFLLRDSSLKTLTKLAKYMKDDSSTASKRW